MSPLRSSRRVRALAAVALAAACGACSFTFTETVHGSGNSASQTRAVAGFDELRVEGQLDVQVVVAPAGAPTVRVLADDNQVPYVMTASDGGKLRVYVRSGYRLDPPARIEVSAPALHKFVLSGSGAVEIEGAQGAALELRLEGSGEIAATGVVDSLEVHIAGSGEINLFELVADSVDISVAGSGAVEVHARESLAVSVMGSGAVVYRGEPQIQHSIAGSGEVRPAR